MPFTLRQKKLHPDTRTTALFLGFCVCFVILSISTEGLFFLMYSGTLYMWTHVEAALYKSRSTTSHTNAKVNVKRREDSDHQIRADDIRIAVFFLFFVQLAFFGTGK